MSMGSSTLSRMSASLGRSQVSRVTRSSSSPWRTAAVSGASGLALISPAGSADIRRHCPCALLSRLSPPALDVEPEKAGRRHGERLRLLRALVGAREPERLHARVGSYRSYDRVARLFLSRARRDDMPRACLRQGWRPSASASRWRHIPDRFGPRASILGPGGEGTASSGESERREGAGRRGMIQARKLGHVVLKVRDVEKSKEFYTRVLGLKVAYDQKEWGAVFLSVGEQHHDLALFQLATGEAPTERQPGLHHMAWQLGSFAELQAAYRELTELGTPVDATIAHNVTRSIYFPDPDGNRVELYCDMVENGFEAMQTLGPRRDHLDIETGEVVSR